ncbi:hypothetical protein D0Z00_002490 [Geotrichum galactomycetum]|uniref:Uncharacterized protein n=1 Tax=Geotrichum galactomycetum TaxID=27317 RepID=A0ACB6V405_9ASCO|nr:hypothetical protein D0Z00_002490 [Geotrichum candidum]
MYLKPLIVALAYTWSQDHADTVVSFYFLRIKASYVPVLLLLVDLIMFGQLSMLVSGTGYVAGHLYLFLDVLYPKAFGGSRLISTPQFLTRLFLSRASSTKANGAFTAYRPTAKTGNTTGTASSSGKSSSVGSGSASSTGSSTGFGRFSLSSGPFQGKGRRLGE